MGKPEETQPKVENLQDYTRLRLFNLFDNLSEDELRSIGNRTQVRRIAEGEVVCREDADADSMYFICSGAVTVARRGVEFAHLEAGDYFGEMSLVTGRKRNATVTTLSASLLFEISAEVFDDLFETSPTVMHNLLLTYDARLRRHNDVVVGQFLKLKHQFEELEDSHNRLLLSDKLASIGLLTAGIAHEINNPLFVITGYLDVLREAIDAGETSPEALQEIAEKLTTASRSIVRLVSGIKTYARIEDTEPTPIDLNAAIQGSLNLVSYLYRQEGIELREELEPGLPMILGNLGKLQQVLMNLFSNAKDAMESSDEKIIRVATRQDGSGEAGKVIVEVSDTGCGIDPEQLQRVFTRGYTTKPVGKGSGMGLDLVRRIVQEMGGAIRVDSEPASGTCFTLTFNRME